jgi:cysteinyl-tRNA synthetase
MSKSLGNFFTLRDLLEKGYTGREIRYVLVNAHYRQPLNFTFDALAAARTSLARLDECLGALEAIAGDVPPAPLSAVDWAKNALDAFTAAVNDDLNIPEAFAAMFGLVRAANVYLAQSDCRANIAVAVLDVFRKMDKVLGVVFFGRVSTDVAMPAEIKALLDARAEARAGRNWAESDRLRDELARLGWEVRDSKDGQKIKKI